jgi:hypothetical protein
MKNAFLFFLSALCLLPSAVADQSATLAWSPNPEPDVSSYVVYHGFASRSYPMLTNVGNVTTATITGLKEGSNYFFAITAVNTSGLESDFSDEVVYRVPALATNTPPIVYAIANQTIHENKATNIAFNVWDVETYPGNLTVKATSSKESLITTASLIVTGTNHNRFLQITPVKGQFGDCAITVQVSDGQTGHSVTFVVKVLDAPSMVRNLTFIHSLQASTSMDGPWTNLVSTTLPVVIPPGSTLFYRTWLDVK